jgi:hypothetical protein
MEGEWKMTVDSAGFDEALCAIKKSQKKIIRRGSWKPRVPSVSLLKPIIKRNDPASKLNPPLIFYQLKPNKDGSFDRVQWLPTLQDLLAEDWIIE